MKFKNRMTMCLLECIQNLSHLVIKTYKRTIKIYLLKRGLKFQQKNQEPEKKNVILQIIDEIEQETG